MKRTIVIKVVAKNEAEYAHAITTIANLPFVQGWRASSMNRSVMAFLRASNLNPRWLSGSIADAVKTTSKAV